jgi:hypothetical protein
MKFKRGRNRLSDYFAGGFQFWMSVMGEAISSSTVLIRKRLSGATSYSGCKAGLMCQRCQCSGCSGANETETTKGDGAALYKMRKAIPKWHPPQLCLRPYVM